MDPTHREDGGGRSMNEGTIDDILEMQPAALPMFLWRFENVGLISKVVQQL
jgi:hypothetical protein